MISHYRQLADIHTHTPGRPDALLSLLPEQFSPTVDTPFSLSLHPWYLGDDSVDAFHRTLAECHDHPWLMGIGECGLDLRCPTPIGLQQAAFLASLKAARDLHLPTIVHCVGAWGSLQSFVRQVWGNGGAHAALEADAPIIIHGFRKGPQLASQLLAEGFCLSLGRRYNEAVLPLIPPDRLFHESDED